MDRDEIRQQFLKVLNAVQTDSGHDKVDLSDQTVPTKDLVGFDSLACVDAEVRLSEALGVDVEGVPFKSAKSGQGHSVDEIVTHLYKRYGQDASRRSATDKGSGT